LSGPGPKTNCAGRECPERSGCRRYEVRIPDRIEIVKDHHMPRLEWASFDIERMYEGNCPHRIANNERLMRKAA
jgi:hypothetical protein